ncbi:MAG: amidase [Verrucomicrobia bacterium]|nr:amidase [Verrucomicrobiota bacterium]
MKRHSYISATSLLIGLFLITCFSDCAIPRRLTSDPCDHAFIRYWPPPKNSKQLRLAVKDLIDVKGVVTTAGSEYVAETSAPAKSDAACLMISRTRNVQIVGKTNLSEFAVAPSGINDFFGTPGSPLSKRSRLMPGGSSSGSAIAIANALADVAFGTDTAGSIRVPAACCGILGLKTTFGLVSLDGVFPVEPTHMDTVGPMGKDVERVVQGMDLLQDGFAGRYRAAVAAKPSGKKIRIGRLRLSGTDPNIDEAVDDALVRAQFEVIPLDQEFREKWDQANKDGYALAAAGVWRNDRKYLNKLTGVSARTKAIIVWGKFESATSYNSPLARQTAWQQTLQETFKKVDFIALPTLQKLPPSINKLAFSEAQMRNLQNTVPVNFAGNPALAIPIPLRNKTLPATSLQLVGPRLSEAGLLNAGRLVESSSPM